MKERIDQIRREIENYQPENKEQVEEFRIKYLSKKGIIPQLFTEFKNVPKEERKELGKLMNELKNDAQQKFNDLKASFEAAEKKDQQKQDLTLPAYFQEVGARHPINILRNEITEIFKSIGFQVNEGPEIEDDWHNFTALNFPPEHPARDMQDTFFVDSGSKVAKESDQIALRTHTSSVQIRVMENQKPPIRSIFPGRVYRNEAISARAHCMFHQVEGLYVDKGVSFADLKQTMLYFSKEMFGKDTRLRFRPSYFPFTEPSAELDISCFICGGKGCNICKYTGFVEILGCGMVDPNVLENCGIDSKKYAGFAFGMGIERIGLLKYQINDLRLFFENDMRFLKQFESAV
ncbi:MAG: phenylalanine--tRNA ligase subunit alpha [Bacteroidales bacterium]|nr:phenylalanine--tRNA ligase subunit alpha [Bacteroidales bacterium]